MNNTSNLKPFVKDGLELVIDLSTGASYAPGYNALARICSLGLEKPIFPAQVQRHVASLVKGVTVSPLLEAEINTAGGKQAITLISENLMARTIRKFNEFLSDKIDEAGMRVFAHKLAGYEISSTATTPRKVSELDWGDFTEILESKITQIVRRELATTQDSPPPRIPPLTAISGRLSKDNQIKLAYEQILEIRDRWCETAGISVSATDDNAFVQAIQNGKVPEVEPLLKFVKWGTSSGISRGTLRRIRAKLKNGITPRNLDRPKEKKIDKYQGISEWVQAQRKQHPEEPIACLHRRMQLQHPDKPVSLSTLMRWLETF